MRRVFGWMFEWLLTHVVEPVWFTPYEQRSEPLVSRKEFARRAFLCLVVAVVIQHAWIALGTIGYHYVAGLSWVEAVLHASMVFGDMGQTRLIESTAGKFFGAGFTFYGALVFLACFSTMIRPWLHRMTHRFHLDPEDRTPNGLIVVARDGDIARYCGLSHRERVTLSREHLHRHL